MGYAGEITRLNGLYQFFVAHLVRRTRLLRVIMSQRKRRKQHAQMTEIRRLRHSTAHVLAITLTFFVLSSEISLTLYD
jgi:hypothetical protein